MDGLRSEGNLVSLWTREEIPNKKGPSDLMVMICLLCLMQTAGSLDINDEGIYWTASEEDGKRINVRVFCP